MAFKRPAVRTRLSPPKIGKARNGFADFSFADKRRILYFFLHGKCVKIMNVKQIISTVIESNGMNGEGVSHIDGKAVFIPYTLKGERVSAFVKSVNKRYATASVIKVEEPSAHRVEPKCPYYFKCGGCDMLHVSPEYRRETLLSELKSNFKKIAGIDCDPKLFYSGDSRRNKISMPFALSGRKVVLGLYRQGTHVVEPVECMSADEITRLVARTVQSIASEFSLSVYNENTGAGLLRHLVVREVGGRAQVTVVVNGDGLGDEVERELHRRLPENVDLFICPNTKRNNVILGDSVRLIKGNARLEVNVLGVKAMLGPLSFFQVNDDVRDMLYSDAINCITSGTLVDLYSGIGITSNLAAAKCEKVYAVEVVPQAVEDAKETAAINGNADKITNILGRAEDVLPKIADGITAADVLVDPPRKGCEPSVIRAAAAIKPQKLIYISCNHATMCRDIRLFIDEAEARGALYSIDRVALYDMFPGTHHVETLVCLRRV